MATVCKTCGTAFEVTADDLAFYDHISPTFGGKKYAIPPPTRCPLCRLKHRLAFRNHSSLFQRTDPKGNTIYSMYPPKTTFPVLKNEDWFSDQWDAMSYGRALSLEKKFMEQLYKLYNSVPRYVGVNNIRVENSEYCNNVSDVKNCYLVFNTSYAEDCMYGEGLWGSKDCVENTLAIQSELCYDCTNCARCFNLQSSFNCENCSDSYYLANCRNCRNCFACVNLRNKSYCIGNEQKTKEEFEAFVKTFQGTSHRVREHFKAQFELMMQKHPRPHTIMHQVEDCTGNCILESRNVKESQFIQYGENLKHCFNVYDKTNDSRDYTFFGRTAELIYNCCSCGIHITRLCFCYLCRNQDSDLFYCMSCDGCKNCFGCVGLWRKEYCILNTQYTREDYEATVPKLIEHMRKEGEWGEFFPVSMNATPYNRSIAQRYYPLTKEEAEKQGYSWFEEDIKDFPDAIDAKDLPDGLPPDDTPITVKSAVSGRPFRITTQEIERYRNLRVPLPRISYEERLDQRAKQLGGLKLHERNCAKTGKKILTPYPPGSPYIIWDRDEYEKEFQ